MKRNYLFLLISLFFFSCVHAKETQPTHLSMDLQNIEIQDALHILAKFLHQDIVVSPSIHGNTALYVQHMSSEEAINLILTAHDLVKIKIGNAWFISTREDVAKHQEQKTKQHALQEETSPLITHLWQIHYAKAEDLGHLLEANNTSFLSKRGHVRVDARTNTLCVQDTEAHLIELKQMIKRLDVPVDQVLIEARLVSIDQDFEQQLGLHFNVKEEGEAHHPTKHYSLAVARLADGSQLDVQLAALENQGHGDIISSPSLFTGNQQTAVIESGEEIPYQEISEGGGTAVSFKKAVLSLKVTPQILPEHTVLLQLQINQDRPNNRVILGVPAITTRQISTHVLVKHGQTIVLGGIYETNCEHSTQRVPFLGKIPLVGWLFKQQNVNENKRELLIFVTPRIISFTETK